MNEQDNNKLVLEIMAKTDANKVIKEVDSNLEKLSKKADKPIRLFGNLSKELSEFNKQLSQAKSFITSIKSSEKNLGLLSKGADLVTRTRYQKQDLMNTQGDSLRELANKRKAAREYESITRATSLAYPNANTAKDAKEALGIVNNLDAVYKSKLASQRASEQSVNRTNILNQKAAQVEAQIIAAKMQGNALEASSLAITKQKIALEQTLAQSNGKVTAAYRAQLTELEKMKQIHQQLKLDTPRQTQKIDFASLFRVQADLLLNYTLMGQVFNLFSFGKTYVLEFEDSLKELQGVTQATNGELSVLGDTFVKVSQETRFSAVEISKAALVMGQAGFSSSQIGEGIKDIALLATATGSDLATAVDVTTSAMSIFNLTISDTRHIANVMTESLNLSKLNMDKLALGMQYAGNIAAESGTNLEEFVSILGAIANSGIKSGSTISTGLRQLFVTFEKPTKKFTEELAKVGLTLADVDVKAHGLVGVMENLSEAGFGSSNAMKSMEVRAANVYTAFSRNLDLVSKFKTELLLSSAASRANEIRLESLASKTKIFSNTLGASILDFAKPFTALLKNLLDALSSVLQKLNEMPIILNTIGTFFLTAFSLAIGNRILIIGSALINIDKILKAATISTVSFGAALNFLKAHPILLLATGITALSVGMGLLNGTANDTEQELDDLNTAAEKSLGSFNEYEEKVKSVESEIERLNNRYATISTSQDALDSEVLSLQMRYGSFSDKIRTGVIPSLADLVKALREVQEEFRKMGVAQLEAYVLDKSFAAKKQLEKVVAQETKNLPKTRGGLLSSSQYDINKKGDFSNGLDLKYFYNLNKLKSSPNLSALSPEKASEVQRMLLENITSLQAVEKLNRENLSKLQNSGKSTKELEKKQKDIVAAREAFQAALSDKLEIDSAKFNLATKRIQASGFSKNISSVLDKFKQDAAVLEARVAVAVKDNPSEVAGLTKQLENIKSSILKVSEDAAKGVENEIVKNALEGISLPKGATKKNVVNAVIETFDKDVKETSNEIEGVLGDTATGIADGLSDFYDRSTEELTLKMTEIERNLNNSTAKVNARIAKIDALIGANDNINSANYGRYGDAELALFEKKKFDLQNEALRTQIALYGEQKNVIDTIVKRQETLALKAKEAADAAVKAPGKDGEDRALRAANDAMKDYNNAKQQQLDIQTKLNESSLTLQANTMAETEAYFSLNDQLGESLRQYTAQASRRADFKNSMLSDVVGVLNTAENAFTNFSLAVLNGSATVKDAFKSMVVTILQEVQKILMQKLAAQILGAVVGAFAPTPSIGDASASNPIGFGETFTANNGGVVPKRYDRGGVATRDSVKALLRPGEYVLRNSAVDMIGVENLDRINAMGNRRISKASEAMPSMPQTSNGKPHITNVYIVAPDMKPPLTKDDVIATISEDMLQRGQTMKLVKQIQSGGV